MSLSKARFWGAFLLLGTVMLGSAVGAAQLQHAPQAVQQEAAAAGAQTTLHLPLVSDDSTPLLCRFGVNVLGSISNFDYLALRSGWYSSYNASEAPERPGGVEFVQTIRFTQVGSDDYVASRTQSQIEAIAAANPGAAWLIGNEPDRKDFQDDLEPHVYANAYHDTYLIIKNADPTARVFAGTIVQPTPIRLQYLDLVLDAYQTAYGVPLPTQGWSIHNFILNEVSCDYDDTNCWGAEIPPGVDADFGEVLTLEDNKNVELFKERIVRFRQWMNDNGYGGLPVLLSEYGVLIPEDFAGFEPSEVNKFMNATFDYMLTAADPALGDPNDNYRLIQQFSWYSTGAPGDIYNGYLFDRNTQVISVMGQNYASYAHAVSTEVDIYPSVVTSETVGSSVTISATIANGGNLTRRSGPAAVRFYDGDPATGGEQIGAEQSVSLAGCGRNTTVTVTYKPAASQTVYVVVDEPNRVAETNESNNTKTISIVKP